MLSPVSRGRIWLCTQPTDMRCSFDGLSARVRRHLGEEPTSGHWFVFLNRRRTMMKILGFETGGYWINGASAWSAVSLLWAGRPRLFLMGTEDDLR